MRWLFAKTAETWGHASARRHPWRGLALYGVDGTTVRVPDSKANRTHFGGQRGGHGECGYPLARVLTLTALRSHLPCAARFGPYTLSEQLYALELWSMVPGNTLCIVDRHFFAADILIPLARDGSNRHWLLRAKTNTVWRTVERLGRGEELVGPSSRRSARRQLSGFDTLSALGTHRPILWL